MQWMDLKKVMEEAICIIFIVFSQARKKIATPRCVLIFISSLNRRQLVSTESCGDSVVSYGVRNSIAAYLSFSGDQNPAKMRAESRKKKSKSVYTLPESNLANTDYDDF